MEVISSEFTRCSFGFIQIKGEYWWNIRGWGWVHWQFVKLSVLILSGIEGLVYNVSSCWLSSCSSSNLIFVLKMTGSLISLLSRWDHPMSIIASNFLSLIANDFFHDRFINSTMSHQSKSVLSNSFLCFNHTRSSFSTVMDIFQHPLLFNAH